MIAFDLAYELTLGAACAMMGGERGSGGAFRDGLLVSAFVYVPLCAAGFAGFPGWQTMYLVDLDAIEFGAAWFAALSTAALFGCYALGYALTARVMRRSGGHRRALLLALVAAWVALLAVLFGVLWRRAFTVTTYADFHARSSFSIRWGAPDGLLGGPLHAFLTGSAIANAAAALWLYARLRRRRDGRADQIGDG